jgi:WD40 repeat protein
MSHGGRFYVLENGSISVYEVHEFRQDTQSRTIHVPDCGRLVCFAVTNRNLIVGSSDGCVYRMDMPDGRNKRTVAERDEQLGTPVRIASNGYFIAVSYTSKYQVVEENEPGCTSSPTSTGFSYSRNIAVYDIYGTRTALFENPGGNRAMVMDSAGIIFLTGGHTILILNSQGDVLKEFGDDKQGKSKRNDPRDLTLADRLLVVAWREFIGVYDYRPFWSTT